MTWAGLRRDHWGLHLFLKILGNSIRNIDCKKQIRKRIRQKDPSCTSLEREINVIREKTRYNGLPDPENLRDSLTVE